MLGNLFQPKVEKRNAQALYRSIVSAARQPELYREGAVPDTIEGRLELILLHAALVIIRLRESDRDDAREVSQNLFDIMFDDFDAALRELGEGDSGLGKKIRYVAKGFYGRAKSYETALQAEDNKSLQDDLARNVFGSDVADERSARLAAYVASVVSALEAQGGNALADGEDVAFPAASAAFS